MPSNPFRGALWSRRSRRCSRSSRRNLDLGSARTWGPPARTTLVLPPEGRSLLRRRHRRSSSCSSTITSTTSSMSRTSRMSNSSSNNCKTSSCCSSSSMSSSCCSSCSSAMSSMSGSTYSSTSTSSSSTSSTSTSSSSSSSTSSTAGCTPSSRGTAPLLLTQSCRRATTVLSASSGLCPHLPRRRRRAPPHFRASAPRAMRWALAGLVRSCTRRVARRDQRASSATCVGPTRGSPGGRTACRCLRFLSGPGMHFVERQSAVGCKLAA
mmetsp:Transcript_109047/g.293285  ORF Transcript_109047/g.293285 Transcript_109047/m.293285 type:complete len:267 (+) Transcript_109047:878-1678(+)